MGTARPAFLDLSPANLTAEHLCCALAGGAHEEGVARKRELLARGLGRGLVFRKLDVRGKVFIEYAPAEAAWRPVVAPGYLVIHCLWVSGRYQGRGLGRELLEHCLAAGRDHQGVAAVSGRRPYLTDTRFYLHQGFELFESTATGYDLVAFRHDEQTTPPRFTASARRGTVAEDRGVHFEYAYQCPFVPACLAGMARVARGLGLEVSARELDTVAKVHGAASPFGTFGAFLYGRLVTHELMSERKFALLLDRELRRAG